MDSILDEIEDQLQGPLTLSVVRAWDEQTLRPERVLLDDGPSAALRQNCIRSQSLIKDGTPKGYEGTAELQRGEYFVIDDEETIGELSIFALMRGDAGAMPILHPSDLDQRVIIYCVSIGSAYPRMVFVKKVDPRLVHKQGRFMAIGRERLRILEEPAFSFSQNFDVVIGSGWTIVINQNAFEKLFREIGLVQAHVENWITGITDHLRMNQESIEALRGVALRDSRTWRRLKEIKRRGHLASVSLDHVRGYANRIGLDADELIVDGELVFNPSKRFSILQLLNEDLYRGFLTDDVFEAQRKAAQ